MEIQRTRRPSPLVQTLGGRRRTAFAVAYTLAVLLAGAWLYRSGVIDDALFTGRAAVSNQLRKLNARLRSDPVELRLDVKQEHLLAIAAKREEALRRNLLVSSTDDFVPARIRTGDENLRVEIRLKGDLRDHWAGDKWSLRVRVEGDRTLFGMKQFSLQHPRTRGYLSEWVYHETLRREDLPALRYSFVRVILNGTDKGIYALEEHFEKRLVEKNRLREGPVVRFDEELSWAEAARQGFLRFRDAKQLGGAGGFLAAGVDGFQTSRWVEDDANYEVYRRALAVLDAFRNGEVTTSQAFDVEKLSRFLAVTELLGSAHAAGWRNMRFYFNPVTTRLEPIGFDAGGHGLLPEPSLIYTLPRVYSPDRDDVYHYNYVWFDALFADAEFYTAYVRELERISTAEYLRALLADLAPGVEENLEILHSEFPEVDFSDSVLWENRAYIRSMIEPARALTANLLEQREGGVKVAVGNVQFLPVEVLALEVDGEVVGRPIGGPFVVQGRNPKRPVELVTSVFRLPDDFPASAEALATLRLRHRMLGLDRVRSEAVDPNPPLRSEIAELVPEAPADFRERELLAVDEASATVAILPGRWRVASDLVIPAGWTLVCGEGTTLDLVRGAAIVSRSPIHFTGSADAPIVVRTSDGRGQGLAVIGARRPSVLRHVQFEGLAAPARPGWSLTGAVTFYESPLTAAHCVFRGNTCEDGLNVIRAKFELSSCLFEGTFSDAFDADFCEGRLADCSFVQVGNDGVDVSGSVVELERVFVSGAGDKGISAGEDSRVKAADVRIEGALIGLASKDLSRLVVTRVRVLDCRFGLAAYQKKPEFGPSELRATEAQIQAVEEAWLVERGSRIEVNGEEIEGDLRQVAEMLYGAEG